MKTKEKTNIELILEQIVLTLEKIALQLEVLNRNKNIERANSEKRKNY